MQTRAVFLAAMLILVPLGVRAADLVVWWERGFNPAEEQAIRETVAAFEQKTGKAVELTFQPQALFQPQPDGLLAAFTKAAAMRCGWLGSSQNGWSSSPDIAGR